jgi:hypothetical protein
MKCVRKGVIKQKIQKEKRKKAKNSRKGGGGGGKEIGQKKYEKRKW